MNKPKIAIISFNHPESTITLSKYLSRYSQLDYYYITSKNRYEDSGFSFKNSKHKLGLVNVKNEYINFFLQKDIFNIFLIRLIYHSNKIIQLINYTISLIVINKIKRKKYDYIDIIGQDDLLILFHKKMKNIKRVHTLHEVIDHLNKKRVNSKLITFLFNNRVNIIVHSKCTYDNLITIWGFNPNNVYVVNFGLFECYNMFYNYTERFQENNYCLFYGFLRPYKGLDILLESIKILNKQNKNYRFVIAGYGKLPEIDELKTINTVNLINRRLNNDEIVELNRKAKIIICPYKSGSQSGIIMTSFLFNKPVIVTNVGSFGEIVKNKINGLLISPNSPIELANSINKLYENDELYNNLVENVKKFSQNDEYNWGKISKKMISIFNRI